MLEVHHLASGDPAPSATLTLPFEARQKSRLRARLDDGREVGLFLPRGKVLRDGQHLRADDGTVIVVRAAPERVSTVRAEGRALVRAAYHLGNRHLVLQIGDGFLRYRHDHVLDEMVEGLGLEVQVEEAPFEPEGGAYGGHSHHHGHDHGHGHSHEHGHEHHHHE